MRWFASSCPRFTYHQTTQRKNWRICGSDSLLHTNAGVACCARLFNCSVVGFFLATLLKNWCVPSGFWGFGEQMVKSQHPYLAALPPPCFLLSYSIWPHGLLTLWWPVRLLYWQLFFSLCPQKESTLRVWAGVEKTDCGLNKERQREL